MDDDLQSDDGDDGMFVPLGIPDPHRGRHGGHAPRAQQRDILQSVDPVVAHLNRNYSGRARRE